MQKVEDLKDKTDKELRVHPTHTKRFTLQTKDTGRRISKRNHNKQHAVYYDAE